MTVGKGGRPKNISLSCMERQREEGDIASETAYFLKAKR
jgi:hypothetical protein